MITSGSFAKLLWPGLNAVFTSESGEYPTEYTDIFDTYTSGQAYEEDMSVVELGLASIIPEGGNIVYDDLRQGFLTRYTHIEYGLGMTITKRMMDDNLYAKFGVIKARAIGRSLRQTKEILAANVYNRATNASYTGADSVSLLNSAHLNKSGGTYSNVLAIASDLSEAAIEQAHIDVGRWQDDRGLTMAYKLVSLHIPVELQFEAHRILKSPYRVDSSNNDINAIMSMGLLPGGIKVNHYFTDPDQWVMRTDAPEGMKYWEREKETFASDNDFDTRAAKFIGTFRCSFGWSNPKAVFGSPGA